MEDRIAELEDEIARLKESEERAWHERNIAYTQVKAWESIVYIEQLPRRTIEVKEWGPGEGEQTTIPEVSPKKLTELLNEIAYLRRYV